VLTVLCCISLHSSLDDACIMIRGYGDVVCYVYVGLVEHAVSEWVGCVCGGRNCWVGTGWVSPD
jgi:hypothetical protein